MKKKCISEKLLWEYLDEELEEEKELEVKTHLEKCPECNHQYLSLRTLNHQLMVGINNGFITCDEFCKIKEAEKCVTTNTHNEEWGVLWTRLIYCNIAAFLSAITIIVLFFPLVESCLFVMEIQLLKNTIINLLTILFIPLALVTTMIVVIRLSVLSVRKRSI